MSWLDAFTLAARRAANLPDDWHGYLFTKVDGQGGMVKGLVCRETVSRGPSKGEPRFRTGDKTTERSVFVSTAAADQAARDLDLKLRETGEVR